MTALLGYRRDIDGLRFVAVTMVVACHAGVPGFSGGFTGVDVFFAISGFLITSLLVREYELNGRISLMGFYARRIRRILPPLALVVISTLLIGVFVLQPTGEQQELAQSALAATGFVSNLYFMLGDTGYFAAPAQFMVLLHTWSLGIEEQFYLAWPPVLIGAGVVAARWKVPPNGLLAPLVVVGTIVSFGACLAVLDRSPAGAFHFTPLRAWELGLGALLALLPIRGSAPRAGAILGMGSLAAIVGVTLLQKTGHDFPFAALIAASAAVGMIAAGGIAPRGPATRLLETPPFVFVGKLSYGWYLWHWPLLSFCRIDALGAPSLTRDVALALVALALSWLTWVLIERPCRTRWASAFDPPRRAFQTGAWLSAACVLLASGLWIWGNMNRASTPMTKAIQQVQNNPISFPEACDGAESSQVLPLPPQCLTGATESTASVMVWGDSHARHLVPGLAQAGEKAGIALMPQLKSGCRPGLTSGRYHTGTAERGEERCRQFNLAVLKQIDAMRSGRGLDGVIIASRWSRNDGWDQDLHLLLRSLSERGLRVLVVADPPSYPYEIPMCLARRTVADCAGGRGQMADQQRMDAAALVRIASSVPQVRVWTPADVMCREGGCDLMASGQFLYSDWHHLSPAGSAYLGPFLAEPLAWVAAGPNAD